MHVVEHTLDSNIRIIPIYHCCSVVLTLFWQILLLFCISTSAAPPRIPAQLLHQMEQHSVHCTQLRGKGWAGFESRLLGLLGERLPVCGFLLPCLNICSKLSGDGGMEMLLYFIEQLGTNRSDIAQLISKENEWKMFVRVLFQCVWAVAQMVYLVLQCCVWRSRAP